MENIDKFDKIWYFMGVVTTLCRNPVRAKVSAEEGEGR